MKNLSVFLLVLLFVGCQKNNSNNNLSNNPPNDTTFHDTVTGEKRILGKYRGVTYYTDTCFYHGETIGLGNPYTDTLQNIAYTDSLFSCSALKLHFLIQYYTVYYNTSNYYNTYNPPFGWVIKFDPITDSIYVKTYINQGCGPGNGQVALYITSWIFNGKKYSY